MTSPTHTAQLSALLSLVDDDNPRVQAHVSEALASYGDELFTVIRESGIELSLAQKAAIDACLVATQTIDGDEAQEFVDALFSPHQDAQFSPGQVVRHKRYGYRGVIVEVDEACQADDDWYQQNQTHPDRDQPWYHVLVDGCEAITYPAESSLEAEFDPKPVDHPILHFFFDGFENGYHQRNQRPWPDF